MPGFKKHRYKDFVLTKQKDIKELGCQLVELTHEPSGAQVLHLANDDPENAFCLSFKTYPESSEGTPHILEHTVLCGSKKYPIKDPFFGMLRRSLNTFMNAFTGSDFTSYVAASTVEEDFYNLLEVYLDATFFPKLEKMSFLQEGHRYEYNEGKLEHHGIVFNEMKGALATSEARLFQKTQSLLFPNTPYHFESGGDPLDIPKLSYESFLDFYKKYYHPGHCLFYFYGNIALEKHLDFIEEKILSQAKKPPALPPFPKQEKRKEPLYQEGSYPAGDQGQEKPIMSLSWLTCDITEPFEILLLTLLEQLLMGSDAALLKRQLLNSELCSSVSSILDTEMIQVPWTLVFKGIKDKASAKKLSALCLSTLKTLIKEGFDKKLLEAAINQLELYFLEISGSHMPYGLNLFWRSGLIKQQGGSSEEGLCMDALFEKLHQIEKDPSLLIAAVEKHLINNPHRIELLLEPDPELNSKEQEDEHKDLESTLKTLSKADLDAIVKQKQDFVAFQEKQEDEDLDVLPIMKLEHIPKEPQHFPLKTPRPHVKSHACHCNGLVYADLYLPLPSFELKQLPMLKLWTELLTQVDAGERSFSQNLNDQQAYTGGISAHLSLNSHIEDPEQCHVELSLQGKALAKHQKEFFALMGDLCFSHHFTNKSRLKELILKRQAQIETKLLSKATSYALSHSYQSFSLAGQFLYHAQGLPYLKMLRELSHNLDEKLDAVIQTFEGFKKHLKAKPTLVLCSDEANLALLEKENYYDLLEQGGNQELPPWNLNHPLPATSSLGFEIPSQVAFNVLSLEAVGYTHDLAPSLQLLGALLDNTQLHQSIREQGGAYGYGARYKHALNCFSFHSYRDPHIRSTLEAFENALQAIVSNDFSDQELFEAKLSIIQDLDSPLSPQEKANTSYLLEKKGLSLERRQTFRQALLQASSGDIIKAAQFLLAHWKQASWVSFANAGLLSQQAPQLQKEKV